MQKYGFFRLKLFIELFIAGKVNQIIANHEHFPCLHSSTMGTHAHLATNPPGK